MRILSFDPGDSTGWAFEDTGNNLLEAGTIVKNFIGLELLISKYKPHIVIYEAFRLYPGRAAALSWNDFYPVQVIGVIKYICELWDIEIVEQAASVKKYAGTIDTRWKALKMPGKTEHSKDAYLHLMYYKRREKIS